MRIGIVGMPNIGKSTLFNALTKSYAAPAENFPFCTIDPNVGIVDVKDPRIDVLAEMGQSKKKVYSHIEFVDIAGLVKGASKGEGLGNKFLSHIREVDAIVQVLRYFKDSEVVHVEGGVDPMRDVEIINTELIFADLEVIERILPNLAKKTKVGKGSKEEVRIVEILMEIQSSLIQGKIAHNIKERLSKDDQKLIKSYNFLTTKPIVYAINIGQDDIPRAHEIANEFMIKLESPVAIVCAKLESEMMDMGDEEKDEFIREMLDIDKVTHIPTLNDLIKLGFEKVGLMYYFTTGEKETRSWTTPIGSTAPQAAAAIHTDFEKGFIKAEIVKYTDLVAQGSRAKAKEKGLVKLEGKEYIVQDGDCIIFKFNV
ncbi:MAG: redox-regulated ATPase YchF [candidate division SR1 bacterium]|nr:redox-regulated ATPase YchF [candidate division SR1 bacterium]